MKEDTREKIVEVINKAKVLGWVSYDSYGVLNMKLEDVEKTIIGVLEPEYIDNLIRLNKEAESGSGEQ